MARKKKETFLIKFSSINYIIAVLIASIITILYNTLAVGLDLSMILVISGLFDYLITFGFIAGFYAIFPPKFIKKNNFNMIILGSLSVGAFFTIAQAVGYNNPFQTDAVVLFSLFLFRTIVTGVSLFLANIVEGKL